MCRERKVKLFALYTRKEVFMRDIVVINKKYEKKVEGLNKAKKTKMMNFIRNIVT